LIPDNIRLKIESRFGRKIAYSKDCEALSKNIEKVCNERISTTTLKRIFGFTKSSEKPRLYTLDVLATYIGYADWSNLIAKEENAANFYNALDLLPKVNDDYANNIHLLYHQIAWSLTTQSISLKEVIKLCKLFGREKQIYPFVIEMISIAAQQKNVEFLKSVYNLPFVFDEKYNNRLDFYYVGQTMGLMLRLNPDIEDELIPSLADNWKAQKYFIEWFVDEDYLVGYYGKLLDDYHKVKNKNIDDRLFYYCLKYNQSLQLGNTIHRINWYKKIQQNNYSTNIHPIALGRIIGICISEERGHFFSNTSPYFAIIQEYIYHKEYDVALSFCFYLSRYIYKSRRTDWLVPTIKSFESYFKKIYKKSTSHWGLKIENQFLIYVAYAFHLMGENKKAILFFNKIDTNLFEAFIYKQIHQDYNEVADILHEF